MKNYFKVLIFLLLSAFVFFGCKVLFGEKIGEKLNQNKDVYFEIGKAFGEPVIKELFGLTEFDFERDSILVVKDLPNEKIIKTLGKKIPNFLTQNGDWVLNTEKFAAGAYWQDIGLSDSTRVSFRYDKK